MPQTVRSASYVLQGVLTALEDYYQGRAIPRRSPTRANSLICAAEGSDWGEVDSLW